MNIFRLALAFILLALNSHATLRSYGLIAKTQPNGMIWPTFSPQAPPALYHYNPSTRQQTIHFMIRLTDEKGAIQHHLTAQQLRLLINGTAIPAETLQTQITPTQAGTEPLAIVLLANCGPNMDLLGGKEKLFKLVTQLDRVAPILGPQTTYSAVTFSMGSCNMLTGFQHSFSALQPMFETEFSHEDHTQQASISLSQGIQTALNKSSEKAFSPRRALLYLTDGSDLMDTAQQTAAHIAQLRPQQPGDADTQLYIINLSTTSSGDAAIQTFATTAQNSGIPLTMLPNDATTILQHVAHATQPDYAISFTLPPSLLPQDGLSHKIALQLQRPSGPEQTPTVSIRTHKQGFTYRTILLLGITAGTLIVIANAMLFIKLSQRRRTTQIPADILQHED